MIDSMLSDAVRYEEKAWGRVRHVFASPIIGVSYLEVRSGTRSSIHTHKFRTNHFIGLSGLVVIESWPERLSRPSQLVCLRDGEIVTVQPHIAHRFRVVASGTLIEVYTPANEGSVSILDIQRTDIGGDDAQFVQEVFQRIGSIHV